MKRSEWEGLIKDNNGRHVGTSTILGYPIYAIRNDMGYHKNKNTIPAYVCEITEEDLPLVNDNNVSKMIHPMYICIPAKLLYTGEVLPKVMIQIIGMIAIDSHMRGITAPYADTMRLLEVWTRPHNLNESLEIILNEYIRRINN